MARSRKSSHGSASTRARVWWISGIAVFIVATVAGFAAVTASPDPEPSSSPATSAPSPTPTTTSGQIVAFLGDSYTVGTGADIPQHGYAYIMAAALGGQGLNFGIGGTGYAVPSAPYTFAGRVAQVAAAHPTLVFVQGSVNDSMNPSITQQQVQDAATSTLRALRSALPSARIIVVGPAATPADSQTQLGPDVASVKAAADATGLEFIDTTGMVDPADASLWAPDGVHPDTAGHAELARKLLAAFRSL